LAFLTNFLFSFFFCLHTNSSSRNLTVFQSLRLKLEQDRCVHLFHAQNNKIFILGPEHSWSTTLITFFHRLIVLTCKCSRTSKLRIDLSPSCDSKHNFLLVHFKSNANRYCRPNILNNLMCWNPAFFTLFSLIFAAAPSSKKQLRFHFF